MLAVMLRILKIIGIILLVILGILVLLICMILFNGIKYKLQGKCDGTMASLAGKASFTWLFHLIEGEVLVRNDIFRWEIRIAWLKFSGPPESAQEVEEEVKEEAEKAEKEVGEFVEEEAEEFEEKVAEEPDKIKEELRQTEKKAESVAQETYRDVEDTIGAVENKENSEEQNGQKNEETSDRSDSVEYTETDSSDRDKSGDQNRSGIFKIIADILRTILNTIREFFLAIRAFVLSLLEAVRDQAEAVQGFVDFFRLDVHQRANRKIRDEGLWLLKKIRPRLNSLKLKYGFDDPCLTGEVLAGLGVLYPFLGDNAVIYPDFEKQVFRGNIDLKGKVRLWFVLLAALRLLLDKDVRQTYADMNQMISS